MPFLDIAYHPVPTLKLSIYFFIGLLNEYIKTRYHEQTNKKVSAQLQVGTGWQATQQPTTPYPSKLKKIKKLLQPKSFIRATNIYLKQRVLTQHFNSDRQILWGSQRLDLKCYIKTLRYTGCSLGTVKINMLMREPKNSKYELGLVFSFF